MEENKTIEQEIQEVKETTRCNSYESSESTINLIGGLLNFHKEIESITMENVNPFFKSKYADLSSILSNVNPLLAKNGIFIMQLPVETENQEIYVNTRLIHESGEWMSFNCVSIKKGKDSQSLVSDSTYLKRSSLTSILSLCFDKDDDGNENKVSNEQSPSTPPATRGARTGRAAR